MRRGLTTILLIMLGLLLWGCGSASQSNPSAEPSASPTELVKVTLAAPADGSELLYKSDPFTTHGGPLMVHLEIVKRGTAKIYGDLSSNEWEGTFMAFLEAPGGYWDRAAAPHAAFGDVAALEQGTDKLATQFGAYDDSLPGAGIYILRVEMQNFDGIVTVLELP